MRLQLSSFGLLWTVLNGWITEVTRQHVNSQQPPEAAQARAPASAAAPWNRAADVQAAMMQSITRALPGVMSALQISVAESEVSKQLSAMVRTFRFRGPTPGLQVAQWQAVVGLMLAAAARWRLQALRPLFSQRQPEPLLDAFLVQLGMERVQFGVLLELFNENEQQ